MDQAWIPVIATIFTTVGVVGAELVRQWFGSRNKQGDDQGDFRKDLIARITTLETQLKERETLANIAAKDYNNLVVECGGTKKDLKDLKESFAQLVQHLSELYRAIIIADPHNTTHLMERIAFELRTPLPNIWHLHAIVNNTIRQARKEVTDADSSTDSGGASK